jgi:hypothetical protein
MATPNESEIRDFLTRQVALWNSGNRKEMTDLYRKYARDQLVIEYVGQPIGDGWKTYEHMWDAYGGSVKTDVVEILVNGNEGACSMRNVRVASGLANPSIEIYRFEEGRLHIRYFHRTDTP